MMKNKTFGRILIPALLLFAGIPVLLYALGDFARRSNLKEILSIVTLIAFSLMVGQFFLSRAIRTFRPDLKMSSLVKVHKVVGYLFTAILLLHPFFLVVPRYFESGQTPMDAFVIILTHFQSPGILFGYMAYILMIIIVLMSVFRNRLPIKYTQWRAVHAVLSVAFIATALLHVIDLGRHMDRAFSIYLIGAATMGALLLLKVYLPTSAKKRGLINE
jgi:predicted ferric reductase